MNKRYLVLGLAGVVVVLAGAVWFFFLRSDAPPPATLEDAVASLTTTTTADTAAETTSAPETAVGAEAGLDGSWVVDPAVSFVGYRIGEELASLGSVTAVGRTSTIDAALVFAGTEVSELSVTVDMTTLESDRSQRDGAMRTRGLETSSFPEASYVLTAPIDLGSIPAEGETFTATATGDLTIHGVTRTVEIELEGSLVGGTVVIVGSVEIVLAEYAIEKPTGFSVLDIADAGLLEIQLALIPN